MTNIRHLAFDIRHSKAALRCAVARGRDHDRRADLADHPHRPVRRAARRPHARLHAAHCSSGRLPPHGRGHRRHRRGTRLARDDRGLHAAVGLSPAKLQGDARSGRDRGEYAALGKLAGTGQQHDDALRRGPPLAAGDGEVHARRAALRHVRRQPHRARRRTADRQPVPPPSRSAAQPGGLLEQPAVAIVLVLRPVCRADEPGPAGRRGAARKPLRIGDGL